MCITKGHNSLLAKKEEKNRDCEYRVFLMCPHIANPSHVTPVQSDNKQTQSFYRSYHPFPWVLLYE